MNDRQRERRGKRREERGKDRRNEISQPWFIAQIPSTARLVQVSSKNPELNLGLTASGCLGLRHLAPHDCCLPACATAGGESRFEPRYFLRGGHPKKRLNHLPNTCAHKNAKVYDTVTYNKLKAKEASLYCTFSKP